MVAMVCERSRELERHRGRLEMIAEKEEVIRINVVVQGERVVPLHYPGVVADVMALPFDQVLQAIPAHARVQYSLYFVFLFAFYQDWRRWGSRTSADDGVRSCQSELDDGEDRM